LINSLDPYGGIRRSKQRHLYHRYRAFRAVIVPDFQRKFITAEFVKAAGYEILRRRVESLRNSSRKT
jgi:uncharacterized protein YktA (UPF0223 family)